LIARPVLERDVLILACAISAGIHGALAPGHLEEGTGAAGGFAVSAVLLAGIAVALTRRVSPLLLIVAGAVLTGLLASYALAITTGVPVLHPDPEPVEGLALFTNAVEIGGLVAAADLLVRPDHTTTTVSRFKGVLV
jgi:CHASE2 domain-containing sensor protein